MKSYTDLEQSKKLAEILPLESADMCWCNNSIKGVNYTDKFSVNLYTVKEMKDVFDTALNGWDKYWKLIPCWSLAALLDILAKETHNIDEDGHVVLSSYKGNWWNVSPINCISGEVKESNNPLDACYEMILKLHE